VGEGSAMTTTLTRQEGPVLGQGMPTAPGFPGPRPGGSILPQTAETAVQLFAAPIAPTW